MCGILGTINLPLDNKLLDSIKHRGPDDSGLVSLKSQQHEVILGHRRLSIVDLSPNGHQPMATFDNGEYVVFNGEVYNHMDLRNDLTDFEFRGHSDTETILNSLSKYGIDAIKQFNGIFAFAFISLKRKLLYLGRDPFGVKPVYYSFTPDNFCFSSEIKPLLQIVPNDIDQLNIAELLKLRYSPSPDTLFKSIKKVRPGHYLEIDFSGEKLKLNERSYITPRLSSSKKLSFSQALSDYERYFEQAVDRQLMADVDVGILLSGGIDSALVAAYAQRYSKQPLKAFTVGFADRDDYADETVDAKETAELLGMEHHVVRIGFSDFLDTIKKCVSITEEPLATTSIIPMISLAQLAAKDVKVVLSGQGADESLGGYGRYQGELYQKFIPTIAAKMVLHGAKKFNIKNEQLLRGLYALSEDNDTKRFLKAYTVFDDNEIMSLIGKSDIRSQEKLDYLYGLLNCSDQQHNIERMMSMDLRLNLPDDLLLYTDKVTMRHSLECRVPMLDHDLVSFIESLPYRYRVRLGKSKIIHKTLAEKVLPSVIVHRKKKGFLSPTKKWFKESGLLKDILLSRTSKFSNLFNLNAVEYVIDQHATGFNRERHIFLLLCLYFWMDEFG